MTLTRFFLSQVRVSDALQFINFLRRCLMYTHPYRGWTFTQLCSYIPSPPSSIDAPSCISSLSSTAISSLRNRCRAHSLSFSPLCLLTQERHYSLNLVMIFCPLFSSPGSCIFGITIREQIGLRSFRSLPDCSGIPCIHLRLFSSFLLVRGRKRDTSMGCFG